MLTLLLSALVLAAAPDITFDHILVVGPQGGGPRAPFRVDPVLAQLTRADWHSPAAGDKAGERAWKELTLGEDEKTHKKQEVFEDDALAGGYAFATFEAPEDGVLMLESAGHTMVYVNPPGSFEMHTGDPYENGIVRVPIKVHKGTNSLLFAAGRGHLRAKLTTPAAPVFISPADATMPDLFEGMPKYPDDNALLDCAVVVVNATSQWQGVTVFGYSPGTSTDPLPLTHSDFSISVPPLSVHKVPLKVWAPSRLEGAEMKLEFAVAGVPAGADLPKDPPQARLPFALRVRKADQTRRITFRSDIDGSVQYFGYNPVAAQGVQLPSSAGNPESPGTKSQGQDSSQRKPASGPAERPALILSLHGASVEAAHQAECYTLKPWAALAAPTNRREYGFDWEDWGRLDALEVLGIAKAITKPDPSRIYLTGHSMGGHGTWIIGATYPDHFAAIAPSAGWTTFWSYGGAEHFDKLPHPTPIERMFQRAMNPGDTMGLARNLAYAGDGKGTGVYVLHGDADDNVPVGQARMMKALLEGFHTDFAYHEQAGAGHWWGNQCMDWPPLMDFLRAHTIPSDSQVTHLEFTTANPAVSYRCAWATILQQQTQGDFSSIDLTIKSDEHNFKQHVIEGTTTNVAALAIDLAAFGPEAQATLDIDHAILDPRPAKDTIYITRASPVLDANGIVSKPAAWTLADPPRSGGPPQKGPSRAGPFKQAFNHRAVLVYGTKGSPEENAWMLAKARYDAETIWYRGNGCFDIVSDTDFAPHAHANDSEYKDRSVILYGNLEINAAWGPLLAESPLVVHEGGVFIGEHEYKDDWFAALFCRPRMGSDAALIGAVGITGMRGAHATERLPYFSSGVAYPDWTVLSSRVLSEGMAGVEAAGFFANDWGLSESDSAYASPP
jgi:poly(3-hydroxybutyrate) depolymerase